MIKMLFLLNVLFFVGLSTAFYPVTGVHTGITKRQDGSSSVPARINILDMQKQPETWALFIQALQRFQGSSETFFLSWFQVAGIHGRPYIAWNGVSQSFGSPNTGYCTHNSVLFLPWHRPYLALFEQYLAAECQDIAKLYSNSSFQTAADNFRIPYWDWAAISDLPDVVTHPNISILTPSGYQSVHNPLYNYKFQTFPLNRTEFPSNQNVAGDFWLANYPQTVRGANTQTAGDNPALANSYLEGMGLMSATYKALVKPTTFNEFGTTATQGVSIEAVHNNVHGCVGGNYGHMSYLSYSAFDPIFWLHHANMDRLFALWQAINPSTNYVLPEIDTGGTYTIPTLNIDDVNTPLEPFSQNGNGPWWTAATVQQIDTFGYTYPEFQGVSAQQLKSNVTASINRLYNPTGASRKRSATDLQTREWSAALTVSKLDCNGERFIIRVFIGEIPEDPQSWATSSKCVGSFMVFPPPTAVTGPYPIVLTHYEVDLTKGLKVNGYDPNVVEDSAQFLQKNLEWRVQKFNGDVVPNEQLLSLVVTVQDEAVILGSEDTQLPIYGKKTLHPDVTKGKAGGYIVGTAAGK